MLSYNEIRQLKANQSNNITTLAFRNHNIPSLSNEQQLNHRIGLAKKKDDTICSFFGNPGGQFMMLK